MKNQSFYQSILQNSILVIKVSGKICDNEGSIDNVISDIKELLNSISKLKVVLVFGFGRQLDNYMIMVKSGTSFQLMLYKLKTYLKNMI